ncbi:MAG TPA: ribonuclease HI family protein [Syntrophales bacterium]|nr:ribonuclease HI family protein [Syntrophales bacterium]
MANPAVNLYTDGACRGNPGQGGAGAVLMDDTGEIVGTVKHSLGHCTNNIAEYKALILGLEEALKKRYGQLNIFLDSELLVNQIKGSYKVKNEKLKILMLEVRKLLSYFDSYKIEHIDRSQNCMADKLANEAIDDAP